MATKLYHCRWLVPNAVRPVKKYRKVDNLMKFAEYIYNRWPNTEWCKVYERLPDGKCGDKVGYFYRRTYLTAIPAILHNTQPKTT